MPRRDPPASLLIRDPALRARLLGMGAKEYGIRIRFVGLNSREHRRIRQELLCERVILHQHLDTSGKAHSIWGWQRKESQ